MCSASARLVKLHGNYVCDFVLFCLVAVVCRCFLPVIYRRGVRYGACSCFLFLKYLFRQLTPRDAPPCVSLPISLFGLIAVALSLLPIFYSAVWRTRCPWPCLVFLSGSSCTAYICIWLPFLPYAYYMWLPWFTSLLFLGFSLLNPFLAMMSFAGYFHARFLLYAFFPVCSSYFVLFFPTMFVSDLFWCNFLYLVTTAGFVADQLIM